MIREISWGRWKWGWNLFIRRGWKRGRGIQLRGCYLGRSIIWAVLMIIRRIKVVTRNLSIKPKFNSPSQAHQSQARPSRRIIKRIMWKVSHTSKRTKTHSTVQRLHKSGNATIQTRRDSMEHLLIFQSISNRDRCKRTNLNNKRCGSNKLN